MRSLEIILEIGGISLGELEKERLANKKNTWFVDYIERMAPEEIFPGVKSLIKDMRELGIKTGIGVEQQKCEDSYSAFAHSK